jgi:hypothetical protein
MRVLSIDAGNIQSAYIIFCNIEKRVVQKNILPNNEFLNEILHSCFDEVAIEKIISMGMPVGDTTFQTVFQNGRIYQAIYDKFGIVANLYSRLDIKVHLCYTTRAKDPNVRMALVNRFGEPSTKKNPHNIYNELTDKIYFGTHFWSCLAVAMYHIEPHHHFPIRVDEWGNYKEVKG